MNPINYLLSVAVMVFILFIAFNLVLGNTGIGKDIKKGLGKTAKAQLRRFRFQIFWLVTGFILALTTIAHLEYDFAKTMSFLMWTVAGAAALHLSFHLIEPGWLGRYYGWWRHRGRLIWLLIGVAIAIATFYPVTHSSSRAFILLYFLHEESNHYRWSRIFREYSFYNSYSQRLRGCLT